MNRKTCVCLVLVLACFALPALAQQQQKQPEMSAQEKAAMEAWQKYMTPSEGHKTLDSMVGTFDAKVSMWMQPGQPPMVSSGTAENRWVLGNRYLQESFKGTFMNMPFEGIGYTGYDNARKQFFSTWIDNMSTGIMTSTGNTADSGKTWTFKSVSTDPSTGKDMTGESRVIVTDRDHHTMEMYGPAPDGTVYKMMQIEYSRKK